jgi:mannose-6-phosphate isomerase-like protein (cupin superfamily)
MMRTISLLLIGAATTLAQRSLPPTDSAWAPKPANPPLYLAPNRPHVKLADVRTRHGADSRWREPVADDAYLRSSYVQSAPGERVGPQFHPETRIWWVVLDGELRFSIEGLEPFLARKGAMVQVPLQTLYMIETVGNKPALRFETEVAGARTLYPRPTVTAPPRPPALPGFEWIQVKLGRRKGLWGEGNRPLVTFEEMMSSAKPDERGLAVQQFVKDDRGASNFISGSEKNLAPLNPKDKGHFHPECPEYWLIMAGQMRYAIEGQGVIVASEGDVVYVPPFTYHAPRFHGPAPGVRLSMNGYPYISHLY